MKRQWSTLMNELRELHRAIGLGQRKCSVTMDIVLPPCYKLTALAGRKSAQRRSNDVPANRPSHDLRCSAGSLNIARGTPRKGGQERTDLIGSPRGNS